MAIVITCQQGHRLEVAETLAGRTIRCPNCDQELNVPAAAEPAPRPKSLWKLIGEEPNSPPMGGSWTTVPNSPETGKSVPERPVSGTPASETLRASSSPASQAPPAPPMKSLWSVMRETSAPVADSPPSSVSHQGWSQVIPPGSFRPPDKSQSTPEPQAADADNLPELEPLEPENWESAEGVNLEEWSAQTTASLVPAAARGRSRYARLSLILGTMTLPVSFLAMVPAFWSKLPALALGFAALMFGFLALNDIKLSRGRQTGAGLALLGMAWGILGVLAGPVIVARLGAWQAYGMLQTKQNLTRVNQALDGYYAANGVYPPGGTVVRSAGGKNQPGQSWMTFLLPELGHERLYQSIDLNLPYDAPPNRPALRTAVPEFFASGASRVPLPGGFAVTHFAGVGGEVLLADGGYAHVGVFSENSRVNREDISDGLTHTLVAGEIATDFPAWGAPTNWRVVGKGLNRDRDGFGNAPGTGAYFLLADGSVRFFSNRTDPALLEMLSTRDGEESLPGK